MPTSVNSKARKEKMVTYYADGTRKTVGYRVEEWTTKTKTAGPRARYDEAPFTSVQAQPDSSYTSSKSVDGVARSNSSTTKTSRTFDARGNVVPRKAESSMLPPVVHTEKSSSKRSHGLAPRAENLPNGWIHKEKYERYDYHQGVRRPSYAVNKLTHRVDIVPPSPWDGVKDECYAAKEHMKRLRKGSE